ncbi:MAG: hypothetical protein M1819_005826 [Sarea resinae]|nr:MAG: hypothetical protein M1819_005826 [Sarea resinae]
MERATNCSPDRKNGMSRIERDLSNSPHHLRSKSNGNGNGNGNGHGDAKINGSAMLRRALPSGRKPHVCIVGAGMAGLRAADVLTQHGITCTIIEARDRIGGRVHQGENLGHSVDLGPNWIHGTDNNPFMDLAKETNTTLHSFEERQAVYDENGRLFDSAKSDKYSDLVWSIIADALQHSNDHSAKINPSESLMDFFRKKVREKFSEDWDHTGKDMAPKEAKYEQDTILQMAETWGAFVGGTIERQSLKFLWMEECIEGENLFVAGTYAAMLQKVAEPVLTKANIELGTRVVSVESNLGHTNPGVVVRTADGATQTFDEVIMTTPLGWLKKNKSAFRPALPFRLCQAIDSISYGHLEKVYITFPSAFWDTDTALSRTASEDSHHPVDPRNPNPTLIRPMSPSTSSTKWPGFTHFLHPLYAPPSTNPSTANQEAVSLSSLPGSTAHPTLLFYLYPPTSLHISSLLTSTPPGEPLREALNSFLHPYYSRLPNYNAESADCTPLAFEATNWTADDLAGNGSYCNFETGLEKGDEDVEVMREGLPERGVWLAGEHTAPFVGIGTVTGAYWSGEGVARRIVGAYAAGADGGGDEDRVLDGEVPRNGSSV